MFGRGGLGLWTLEFRSPDGTLLESTGRRPQLQRSYWKLPEVERTEAFGQAESSSVPGSGQVQFSDLALPVCFLYIIILGFAACFERENEIT